MGTQLCVSIFSATFLAVKIKAQSKLICITHSGKKKLKKIYAVTSEKGCFFSPKKKISQQDDKEDEAGTTRSPETAACKVKCHGAYVTSALMSRGRKYQSEPISQNGPPKKVSFPPSAKLMKPKRQRQVN